MVWVKLNLLITFYVKKHTSLFCKVFLHSLVNTDESHNSKDKEMSKGTLLYKNIMTIHKLRVFQPRGFFFGCCCCHSLCSHDNRKYISCWPSTTTNWATPLPVQTSYKHPTECTNSSVQCPAYVNNNLLGACEPQWLRASSNDLHSHGNIALNICCTVLLKLWGLYNGIWGTKQKGRKNKTKKTLG